MADLMLVDDDERIVELLAWFLRRAGHTVRCAPSYAAARALLAERRPDLLLADLELGEERGDEELPRLSGEGLLPSTLVVSGYLDPENEERLRRLPGVVGTLQKPFDLAQLEQRLTQSLWLAQRASPVAVAEDAAAIAGEEDEDGWIEILPATAHAPRASRAGEPV